MCLGGGELELPIRIFFLQSFVLDVFEQYFSFKRVYMIQKTATIGSPTNPPTRSFVFFFLTFLVDIIDVIDIKNKKRFLILGQRLQTGNLSL